MKSIHNVLKYMAVCTGHRHLNFGTGTQAQIFGHT